MANIMLICPSLFGYEDRIANAMRNLGHNVTRIDERVGNGFWEKSLTRLGFSDLMVKKKRAKISEVETFIKSKNIEKIIVISPETISGNDVLRWKMHNPEISVVIYNWDSQKQKPVTLSMQRAADIVFSFDRVDCKDNNRFHYLPLFHCWDKLPEITQHKDYDFSFIGSGRVQRIKILASIENLARKNGQTHFFYIFAQSQAHYILFKLIAKIFDFRGIISQEKISYPAFLETMAQTRCVIDIEHDRQTGLTMRTIETVFGGQAIATTNAEIIHDDFYQTGSIFILDRNDLQIPSLTSLSHKIDEEQFIQYGIKNWVQQLLTPATETLVVSEKGQ